ncbi:MAG: sulfatase-like hydrolase/transferase, partial [Sandaracinaceae bacterium]|nr:sulfatase-like hydrolase/transferase [Sandaracinaceae bacterium]
MLGALLCTSARASAQSRPNFVLIVADDLGRGELGAYGQEQLATPALDALAARGARFSQAYTTVPVCAPSRCSILTGLHAGHCAVTENDEPNLPLPSRDPTVAEMLALAGYHRAMVGKWALGGELDDGTPWNVQSAPWRVGFEHVLGILDQEIAQDHYPSWLWRASPGGEPAMERLEGNDEGARSRYAPDLFSSEAVARVRDTPEPFFLYFAMTLPHRELVPPPGSDADPSDADATYAAMVARLDAQVGAIVAALEARGISERTYVVFTSDNGPNSIDGHRIETFASSSALRGQKRDLYEGGVRVPLLVAGPDVAPRVLEEPVMLADLFPTFASLADAPVPRELDGRSFAEELAGSTREGALHDHLYFECNERRGGAEAPTRRAVRRGRWKWIRSARGDELYDLEVDPAERHDVAAREPEIVAELARLATADDAPRVPSRAPALVVRAGAAIADRAPREAGPTPLLVLDPDDVEDDGRSWPQRIESPALVATLVGPELVRSDPGHLRFEGEDHVVVPSHPALAVFGGSFSLHARVRLTALASEPTRDQRQWLVFAKPTGLSDVHAAFGLLVQGGDLGCAPEAPHACSGREITLFFGDPRLDPARPLVLPSTLTIDDDAVHEIVVRVDRTQGSIELELDERSESLPFLVQPGIEAEAPIVIGGHHDASGRFAQGLRGELSRFALAEGTASRDELRHLPRLADPRHLRVRLGDVALGGEAVVALELESLPLPAAHWIEAEIEPDEGVRAELEGGARRALFAGDVAHARVRLD